MSPPHIDEPGDSMIELHRTSAWGSKLFGWSVELDGHHVATMRDGDAVSLRVKPGVHVLQVRNGRRHQSNALRFEIAADATLGARVGQPDRRVQGAGPLGRFAPVLTWERQSGEVDILGE